jgi:hypothetical protein
MSLFGKHIIKMHKLILAAMIFLIVAIIGELWLTSLQINFEFFNSLVIVNTLMSSPSIYTMAVIKFGSLLVEFLPWDLFPRYFPFLFVAGLTISILFKNIIQPTSKNSTHHLIIPVK